MDILVDALVPGMPPVARSAVTSQAQGIPLFAVETVRSLIDRDVVQPVEGVYRLVGDVGELAVPDSLHALLASRLDALDSGARRLVADAAVLGTTFPAEALISVSGQDEATVRAALGELVRREVFTVSADPLSPEKGSYGFAQQMLRQVAYGTLSRRDRKARHLKVAVYLRAAFAGDGDEVAEVIARHYLDALDAVPEDTDARRIRGQAIAALIRAAERAERTGAPALAAASYATAAELTLASAVPGQPDTVDGQAEAGQLWERAADAAFTSGDWATASGHAGRARDYHTEHGQARAAARAQAIAGQALRLWGRHAEAREQLTAAVEVLRPHPDADTVGALGKLAALEVFAGSPDGGALTTEALILGQALGVGSRQLCDLFTFRGVHLGTAGRRPEAASYFREAARLGTQAGDNFRAGRALLDLADVLAPTDPAASAEAARTAARHARQAGAKELLAVAIANLAQALLMLGDWDGAEAELVQAADGLAGIEFLACCRAWVAALRGDADTAETMLAGLADLRASEGPQDKASVNVVEAFTAAARHRPKDALRHARATLAHAGVLGFYGDQLRWAWPLAARTADELADAAILRDLVTLLDNSPPGHLAPMLLAERDLVRARLAAREDARAAATSFTAAVGALREQSTPYHLAHGLLDHAWYLNRLGDTEPAAAAITEARTIAGQLRCQPLLDRAAGPVPAQPPIPA